MVNRETRDLLAIDYRALVEHIAAITYIAALDADSSTLYVCPQIETIFGFSQSEWMADDTLWLKQIHPDDRAFVLQELARIHAGGEPQPCEYRMLTRDGTVLWFLDHASVQRGADVQSLYLCEIMLDITEKMRLDAELSKVVRELAEGRKPRLDERELAVLLLLREGRTGEEIGTEIGLSERTVRNCLKAIRTKLGVASRLAAVAEAVRLGLLDV